MGQDKKLKPFRSQSESFGAFKDEGMYYVDKTGFIPYLVSMVRGSAAYCVVITVRLHVS